MLLKLGFTAMLAAEHFALQSRLVQQLASVKQRELCAVRTFPRHCAALIADHPPLRRDFMLTRYQNIGLQSALVGGFAIQTLVSVNPSGPETADPVEYMFFTIGLMTVLCNVHVITCTLFVGNWAPGLALRGPTGSLSRAFDATMGERKHITYAFICGLVMFVVQTVIAVWVEDGINGFSPHVSHASVSLVTVVGSGLQAAFRMPPGLTFRLPSVNHRPITSCIPPPLDERQQLGRRIARVRRFSSRRSSPSVRALRRRTTSIV